MNKKREKQRPALLDAFIIDRIKNYDEPQRAGTPKGEPIGFSRKKYNAALLDLYNLKQKVVAEGAGVSHGLLRKWRTEGAFLDLADDLKHEYVDYVIQHLKKRAKKHVELRDEYFALSPLEMINTPPPQLSMNEFQNLPQYDIILVPWILNKLFEIASNFDKEAVFSKYSAQDRAYGHQCMDFLNLLSHYPFKEKNKETEASQEKTIEAHKSYQHKVSLELLKRDLETTGNPSEETLKATIYSLHYSSGSFTPVDMDY
jgi:hypothetical protein